MSVINLFADNASSLLASAILSTDTTLTVTATQGSLFPTPGASQIAKITLEDTGGNIEIVHCTGRTGDTMTIVRAQEGTSASAFASGSRVEQRCTAGMLQAFLQKNGGDTLSGTTNLSGVFALGSSGSIQGGEFTGPVRSGAGVTAGQIFVSGGVPMSGTAVILTSTNINANMPSGTALIVTQMIVMWAGTSVTVPAGWHVCDGTNGTPDLRDQFIIGGSGALPTSGTYSANTASTTPGGGTTGTYTLTLGDIPSHLHPFDFAAGSGGAPFFGIPGFTLGSAYIFAGSGGATRNAFAGSPNTGAGTNAHAHTYAGVAHQHAQQIPYRAVFAIMKL